MQQTNRQMKQANKQTNGGGITISFLFHLLWEGTPQIHSFAYLRLLSIHLSALFGISFHVLTPHWWGVPSYHETCLWGISQAFIRGSSAEDQWLSEEGAQRWGIQIVEAEAKRCTGLMKERGRVVREVTFQRKKREVAFQRIKRLVALQRKKPIRQTQSKSQRLPPCKGSGFSSDEFSSFFLDVDQCWFVLHISRFK